MTDSPVDRPKALGLGHLPRREAARIRGYIDALNSFYRFACDNDEPDRAAVKDWLDSIEQYRTDWPPITEEHRQCLDVLSYLAPVIRRMFDSLSQTQMLRRADIERLCEIAPHVKGDGRSHAMVAWNDPLDAGGWDSFEDWRTRKDAGEDVSEHPYSLWIRYQEGDLSSDPDELVDPRRVSYASVNEPPYDLGAGIDLVRGIVSIAALLPDSVKKCPTCRQTFIQHRPNQEYCSDRCSARKRTRRYRTK